MTLAAGDYVVYDFIDHAPALIGEGAAADASGWEIVLGVGASVNVDFTLRPDYDPAEPSHWHPHELHQTVTEATIEREKDNPQAALRFTAAGGSAEVAIWSPVPVSIKPA